MFKPLNHRHKKYQKLSLFWKKPNFRNIATCRQRLRRILRQSHRKMKILSLHKSNNLVRLSFLHSSHSEIREESFQQNLSCVKSMSKKSKIYKKRIQLLRSGTISMLSLKDSINLEKWKEMPLIRLILRRKSMTLRSVKEGEITFYWPTKSNSYK